MLSRTRCTISTRRFLVHTLRWNSSFIAPELNPSFTTKEKIEYHKVANDLVKAAARGDRYGWEYDPSRGAERKHLKGFLSTQDFLQDRSRIQSEEATKLLSEAVGEVDFLEEDDELSLSNFEPGSFVELRRFAYFLQ